jgi:penicillin-binding protein 1C
MVGVWAVLAALTIALLATWVHGWNTTLVTRTPSRLVLDRHGAYLGEARGDDDNLGYWALPAILPDRLVTATLETEDRHFHEHHGVHVQSVLRALWQDVRARRVVSGASTLAMQVARMQDERGGRSPLAKVREALEAWFLVDTAGHDAVLRQYLTLAPYGNRVHGAARAARFYFDKPVQDLSWLQAAYLAALPQSPGRMNPSDDDGRMRGLRRAHRILALLHTRGLMDDVSYTQALASPLGIVPHPQRPPDALHAALMLAQRARSHDDEVLTSTLDLDIQHKTAVLVQQGLKAARSKGATNAAAVVLDRARGDVLAYVGSADYFAHDDRGAIDFLDVKRSPGSVLKPFIYGAGLDRGLFTAASVLADTPMDLVREGGRSYVPQNVSGTFLGPMLLREALGNSRNIPALRVLSSTGVEPVLSMLERGGVRGVSYEPGRYGLSLALGALPTTPLEVAGLYLALGHEGVHVPLRYFSDDAPTTTPRLFGRDTAQLLLNILADDSARQPSFPSGSALAFDIAVAVKTGTSQGERDSWAAMVSDRLVVVVWMGNHDERRMPGLSGASGAAKIAHSIVDAVMPLRAPQTSVASTFPPPADAHARVVCALTGQLAGPHCPHQRTEWFTPGTEPVTTCEAHVRLRLDRRNGLRATSACPRDVVVEREVLDLPETFTDWARAQHMALAPHDESPLCGGVPHLSSLASVAITEPRNDTRFTIDPDAPPELSTVPLRARVASSEGQVVFLVDGTPVAWVGYPYETRWPLTPGRHVVQAVLASEGKSSAPIAVTVRR